MWRASSWSGAAPGGGLSCLTRAAKDGTRVGVSGDVPCEAFGEVDAAEVRDDGFGDASAPAGERVAAVEDVRPGRRGLGEEPLDEPALPDSDLAREEEDAAFAARREVPRLAQGLQFRLAAEEARLAPHRHPRPGRRGQRGGLFARGPPRSGLPRLERVAERGRRREPRGRVLLEQRGHDGGEEPREARAALRERGRREGQVGAHDGPGLGVAERVVAGGQLVEDDAERVEVGRRTDVAAAELLGRRVVEAARELGRAGQFARRPQEPRHAEVHDADAVVVGQKDVLRLQVPVDDTGGVDGREPVRHLPGDLAQQRLGESAEVLQQRLERAPLHVLHHEVVQSPAADVRRPHVEGPHDVVVADPAAHLPLPKKPLEDVGPRDEGRVDDPDRHAPAARRDGLVHRPRAARPDRRDQGVPTQLLRLHG